MLLFIMYATSCMRGSLWLQRLACFCLQLSESERCYFCGRHVYVIERMSAEGLFFHRKCFRCTVCKCHLLPGSYAFDADDDEESLGGKFYCKLHFSQLMYKSQVKDEPIEKRKIAANQSTFPIANMQFCVYALIRLWFVCSCLYVCLVWWAGVYLYQFLSCYIIYIALSA